MPTQKSPTVEFLKRYFIFFAMAIGISLTVYVVFGGVTAIVAWAQGGSVWPVLGWFLVLGSVIAFFAYVFGEEPN